MNVYKKPDTSAFVGGLSSGLYTDLSGMTHRVPGMPPEALARLDNVQPDALDQAAKIVTVDACRNAIRGMALTVYRADSCLAVAKIVADVLTAAGLPNRVQPVNAVGLNSTLLQLGGAARSTVAPLPKIIMIGSYHADRSGRLNEVASLIAPNPEKELLKRKYLGRPYEGGHLVNIAYVNGDPILIDWTIDQMADPARGMYLSPFMCRLPQDLSEGPVAVYTRPQDLGADPALGTTLIYEALPDTTYRTSPAWLGADPAVAPLSSAALGFYSAAYVAALKGTLRADKDGGPSLSDRYAQPIGDSGELLDPALQPVRYLKTGVKEDIIGLIRVSQSGTFVDQTLQDLTAFLKKANEAQGLNVEAE